MATAKEKKQRKILLGVGLIGAGVGLIYWAKKKGQELINNISYQAGTPQIDMSHFQHGFIRVVVPVTIENKNSIGLGLDYFEGVISYGQIQLAQININTPINIGADTTTIIDLPFDIPVAQLSTELLGLIMGGNLFNVAINPVLLNGWLKVQNIPLPIPLNNINIPIIPA